MGRISKGPSMVQLEFRSQKNPRLGLPRVNLSIALPSLTLRQSSLFVAEQKVSKSLHDWYNSRYVKRNSIG